MADNVRFHNKYHRRNHHSSPSTGYPDSGSDPIASQTEPFVGGFYIQGPLSAAGNMTIGGNTLIRGNLSALGDVSVIDTYVTITSALSVVNNATGPALTVIQRGVQDIAQFMDDAQSALKIMDGAKIRFFEDGSSGAIGINTNNTSNALSLKGTISAVGEPIFRALAADGSGVTIAGPNTTNDTQLQISRLDTDKFNFRVKGTTGSAYLNVYDQTNGTAGDGFVLKGNNVGIGNATPLVKLTVSGNISATGALSATGTENNYFASNVGIGISTPLEKLTVQGNISASNSCIASTLCGRYLILAHSPANDGTNPTLSIGEYTGGSTTLSAFTGYRIEYDETTNALNLSSIGFDAQKQIVQIEKGGLVTLANGICAIGTSYTQFLTSRDITIAHSPANDGTNPTLSIGEYTGGSTTLSAFSGYRIEYDETTNDLNLSALGFNTARQALKITPAGNINTNLLSAISPNYFNLNNLITNLSAVTGLGQDNLSHFIGGRMGINTTPVSSYAMHVRGGNIRVDGVDYSAVPGFDGTIYDSDGQSLFDLRSAAPNANYSLSIASSGLNNFMKLFGGRSLDQNPFVAVRKGQPIRFAQFNNFYGQGFSEVARIGGNSNVSIGLSADGAERLTVLGNISASGNVLFNSSTGRNLDLIHTPANDGTNPVLRIGELTPGDTALSGFSGAFISYDESTNVFGISSVFEPARGVPAIAIDRNGFVGHGTDVPKARMHNIGTSYNQIPQFANTPNAVYEHVFGLSTGSRRFLIANDNKDLTAVTAGTNNLFEVIRNAGGYAETRVYTNAGTVDSSIMGGANSYLAKTSTNLLGVGTDTPTEKLTVLGNISASGNVLFNSSTGRNLDLIHIPANDGTNPVLRIGECTPGDTALSGFSGAFVSYDEFTNTFGISSQFAPAMATPAMSIDRNGYFFTSSNASPRMTIAYAMTSANFLLSATNTTFSHIPLFTVPNNVLYYVPGVDVTFTLENVAGGNTNNSDQMPVFRLARGNTGATNQEMSIDLTPFSPSAGYNSIGWCRQSTNTTSGKTMALPGDTVYLKVRVGYNNTNGTTTAYSILSGRVILTGYYILP
jgi:hypothetical protein